GHEVANLIVERRGTQRPDQIVILGAHYDTVDTTPGADDNASAVAVLIEVARLLAGRPRRRTVRFVAFACEEFPHFATDSMGSQVYAHRCRRLGENIIGMLCLEMVGYFTDAPNSQRIPDGIPRFLRPAFPYRGNFLAAVGNLRSIRLGWTFPRRFKRGGPFPLYSISLPDKIVAVSLSDKIAFSRHGDPPL